MLTKKFDVSGMCCPVCITKIQGALETVSYIDSFNVQMDAPQVTIVLKKELPEQEVINVINNSGHYLAKEMA